MYNWLPTVVLHAVIFATFVARSSQLQCSELDRPTWRIFNDLSQFKSSNKTYDVRASADNNWVRIKRLPQDRLQQNEFDALDAGYIVRMDLSHLGIRSVVNGTFKNLYCMETLDLQGNNFNTIAPGALEGMVHLKVLNLTKNFIVRLTSDMFGYMKVLHTLDLSRNVVKHVEENAFVNFPQLQFLNLTFNLITEVDFVQWSLASSLISLNLSQNKLDVVKSRPNMTYPHFTRLDLSFNKLEYLDVPALKAIAPNMALLFIHGNEFHCAFLEMMVEDFARFHFFHRAQNETFYNVDGIDCVGRFDEDLTDFNKTHKNGAHHNDPHGPPAKYFPEEDIPDTDHDREVEFHKAMTLNNLQILEAIHSLRTIIVFMFVFIVLFVVANVVIKTRLTQRVYSLVRPARRTQHHEPIDNSMEIENFRLIQANRV